MCGYHTRLNVLATSNNQIFVAGCCSVVGRVGDEGRGEKARVKKHNYRSYEKVHPRGFFFFLLNDFSFEYIKTSK